MMVRDYRNRSVEEIVTKEIHLDPEGHLYRAVSWLDYFDRSPQFLPLLYACIEARLGIEHLLFEVLVTSTEGQLCRQDFERCLNSGVKDFKKFILQLAPDYEKKQLFMEAMVTIMVKMGDNKLPPHVFGRHVFWHPNTLYKAWGKLSKYLHWRGMPKETTKSQDWLQCESNKVKKVVMPIWDKMSSGSRGFMSFEEVSPEVRAIWNDFLEDKINIESVKKRLQLIWPASL